MPKTILFTAVNNIGYGLSGGDRIFIEFMRGWNRFLHITLFGSEEAIDIAKSRGVSAFKAIPVDKRNRKTGLGIANLFFHITRRIYKGIIGLWGHWRYIKTCDYVYSVSDFYPDMLPALLIKLFNKKVVWIAGFYLFAPSPFAQDNPYKGKLRLKGILFWIVQYPGYILVKHLSDIVLITSQPDMKKFITKKRKKTAVIVVRGGVDITASEKAIRSNRLPPVEKRTHDACFMGRLHPQKGVVALIDIWHRVCKKRPSSKLVIIGDGQLEGEIKDRIISRNLQENIMMVGFKDGSEKESIFQNSKIILHPAKYDSGGMSAAEAMAWGLPGVSFDLESLKTYYPKGIIKTAFNDHEAFADNVIRLLEDRELYNKMSTAAHQLIVEHWDWEKRARSVYRDIHKCI